MDLFDYSESVNTYWDVFRVILEAFEDEEEVDLDYTDLYKGGWCGEYPEEKDFSVPKTIVLTEGNSDAMIISESMKLLYPYMSKFYSFIDFQNYYVQGSTNWLTHYLKAFIAAGIQNRIVAIYDNDAAGLSELKVIENIDLPNNVKVMHLPDLEICVNYPTVGPSGEQIENINGYASSIEMFLGKDVLCPDGKFEPIRWIAFNEQLGTYQGAIIEKRAVQKRFEAKKKKAQEEGVNRAEWEEMDLLLNKIFYAFVD